MKVKFGIGAVLACCVALAACGGSDNNSGGGGGGGGGGASTSGGGGVKVEGAKVIDAKSLDNPPKGTVKFCQGKDTTGIGKQVVKDFTTKYGAQGWKATLTEFPASADQQRSQFIQRQQAKSDDCDVFSSDVIWTAEFASQKWLYDLTPYVQAQKSKYIAAPLETVHYADKYWGVPETSDAAFIYYRTDKGGGTPPSTWQQVYADAAKQGGLVYQGAPYEGLTCDYLELAFAAGGKVLNDDGTKSAINSPQNIKALQLMVNGIKDGSAPKAVTTMMEEPARLAWEAGKVSFMRNWPYAYSLSQKAPKVKGKFDVAPLPSFEGAGKAGILGGHNMVISAYSKNPGAALKFIDFMTSQKQLTSNAVKYSKAPTIAAVYDDPAVKKALPFATDMKAAVEQAKSRPVSPVYPQISEAIFKNVNAALSGSTSPQDALKKADSDISRALSTF